MRIEWERARHKRNTHSVLTAAYVFLSTRLYMRALRVYAVLYPVPSALCSHSNLYVFVCLHTAIASEFYFMPQDDVVRSPCRSNGWQKYKNGQIRPHAMHTYNVGTLRSSFAVSLSFLFHRPLPEHSASQSNDCEKGLPHRI